MAKKTRLSDKCVILIKRIVQKYHHYYSKLGFLQMLSQVLLFATENWKKMCIFHQYGLIRKSKLGQRLIFGSLRLISTILPQIELNEVSRASGWESGGHQTLIWRVIRSLSTVFSENSLPRFYTIFLEPGAQRASENITSEIYNTSDEFYFSKNLLHKIKDW